MPLIFPEWGGGFGPAAGLLASAKGDDWPFCGGFVAESAGRKLGGRAEALPHDCHYEKRVALDCWIGSGSNPARVVGRTLERSA